MKNKIATIIALISLTCNGQGLNGELSFNDDYSQYSKGLVAVDEFSFFINRQSHNSSFFTTCSLIKIDTLENILWSSQIAPQFAETIDVYEIIPSESGGVYILGFGISTCDVGGDCFWFIQKYSSIGSLDWTRTWSDPNCFDLELIGLSLSGISDLLVNYSNTNESKIYTIGAGGIISDSIEIYRSGLNDIDNLTGFEKVAIKQDSVFGFDINGNLSTSLGFNSIIQDVKAFNDTLFLLTVDSIHVLDLNLQEIASTALIGYSEYSNLKVGNNKISFLSHATNNQFVISLDHQLVLMNIATIPLTIANGTFKDFSNSHFATSINFPLTLFTSIRHLDYSLSSNQNISVNSTDIGIIEIQPTQVTATPITWAQNVYQFNIYADVLIKNFGTNTLNDCRINHFIGQSIACGFHYYTEHFSNLNLAPNDSMWLSLGLIHSEENYFPGDTIATEVCVYTSHPNFKTDLNVPNDQYCKNVIIGYTDIKELLMDEIGLYPNPTKTTISIGRHNTTELSFTLFNTLGMQIQNGKLEYNSIDVSELSSGMYLLFLSSKDGSITYKEYFVKE
jgi:hypothetical protein